MRDELRVLESGSGPHVARAFHVVLSLIFLAAWWSLGRQVHVLVGSSGLLPAAPWLRAVEAQPELGWTRVFTVFRLGISDDGLTLGVLAGALLSVASLFGVATRISFALNAALYLSYATICRDFLAFQWDNLLIECAVLAALLPAHRRAPAAHFLLRLALFKLYFESGLAKWQSPLGDWQDGSAMAFYYETAPLPTWLAWYAHHAPVWWHHLESWATLAFELVGPFFLFAPRRARLGVFVVFSGFQIVNIATANYGFFSYLALALHLFLLDDRDLADTATKIRLKGLERLRLRQIHWEPEGDDARTLHYLASMTFTVVTTGIYVFVSLHNGLVQFLPGAPRADVLGGLSEMVRPFRAINNYHLFASITRSRIEPTFEVRSGGNWKELAFHYKPGPVTRAPPLVAPHQPRADFRLWFYGLGHAGGPPVYVANLMRRLCADPAAVQDLFVRPLPKEPEGVRVAFYDYRFTSWEEKRRSGAWWTRRLVDEPRTLTCRARR